jgi:hypothetical protein
MDEWFKETRNTRIALCQPCDPLLHNSAWVGVGKTSYQPSIFTATNNSACSRIGLMREVWMELWGQTGHASPIVSVLYCII